jgi:hypothetical protein
MANHNRLTWAVVYAAAASLAVSSALAQNSAWHAAPAPLMTKWAADVSAENARPEYPRPQLVRKEWKSLNGTWEFAFDDENRGDSQGWSGGKTLPDRILVPFTFESALSGIGKGKEVHERVWYRRTFDVPSTWKGRRVLLNFGAVDWTTRVYVNGTRVGAHTGGYTPFSCDITHALKPGGPQEVVVAVYDPAYPDKGAYQPKGKQLGSESIWYTRTTGIWQSVWLEPVSTCYISDLWLSSNFVTEGSVGNTMAWLRVARESRPKAADLTVDVLVSRNGKRVSNGRIVFKSGGAGSRSVFGSVIPSAAGVTPWTPESPALYDIDITVSESGTVLDRVRSYTAFRSSGMKDGRLTLNGKPYFYRGVLDQGFWPDGIYTPPTDAAIRSDVEMTKKLGFNMARKHVKVDDPRWYYWCDRLGLAVWQDMPSSHNLQSPEAKENFTREWREVMEDTRSHPCVVHWIPFNEDWGHPVAFQDDIVRLTRSIDPSRPITDASGWTQRGLTDVIDAHNYSNSLLKEGVTNPTKPKVVGEFGGIALPVPGHTWSQGWGYQAARDPAGLIRRIRTQTTQLHDAANLSGFVYTQLTDVEQELNGLMTYDRIPKADPKKIAAVFEGRDRARQATNYIRDWIVLGPIPAGVSLDSAANDADNRKVMAAILAKPYLPDEATLQPTAGQSVILGAKTLAWRSVHLDGDELDFHKVFGGNTNNEVAYAVAIISSPREVRNATLYFGSDDGATVWLNGRQAWTVDRIRGLSLDEDTVSGLTLKPGRNVLVVKVGQGVGGWGAAARIE